MDSSPDSPDSAPSIRARPSSRPCTRPCNWRWRVVRAACFGSTTTSPNSTHYLVLLQRLTDWLRLPQRQLVLLANDYEDLRRRRARFVASYRLVVARRLGDMVRPRTTRPNCPACRWPIARCWCNCWTRRTGAAGPATSRQRCGPGRSGLMHFCNGRHQRLQRRRWGYREIHYATYNRWAGLQIFNLSPVQGQARPCHSCNGPAQD